MQTEPINSSKTAAQIQSSAKSRPPVSPGTGVDFEATKHVNQSLANIPVVRPDQVARAKKLLADPNYPSPELLDRISSLLSDQWSNKAV